VISLLLACHPHDSDVADSPAAEPTPFLEFDGPPPRNVVLFVVDTLRADRVTAYSASTGQTAALAPLADHLVVVGDVQAASTWTGPCTSSLLSSQDPLTHGVLFLDGPGSTIRVPTWPRWLGAAGWDTLQYSANTHASVAHGLDDDFAASTTMDDARATDLVAAALAGIEARPNPSAPFFLHLQPKDPHRAYAPPDDLRGVLEQDPDVPTDEDGQRAWVATQSDLPVDARAAATDVLRGLYGEEVLEVDRAFAALLAGLEADGLLDDTLVVLTADHGEDLGDDPVQFFFGHGVIKASVEDIPLLFYNPRLVPAEADGLWAEVDVLPTVFGALRVDVAPPGLAGIDHGQADRTTATNQHFSETPDDFGAHGAMAIADADVRVVWSCDGGLLAYDRVSDPLELTGAPIDAVPGAAPLWDALHTDVTAAIASGGWDLDCTEPP
jgi:arylsulfatase A-like enzyme